MDRWIGKTAVITGAGHGIGAGASKALAEDGILVVGIDVDLKRLEEVSSAVNKLNLKGSFHYYQCDITDDEALKKVFDTIDNKHNGVDICFNCAGISNISSLNDGKFSDWRNIMNVNVIALAACSQLSIKSMERRTVKEGHIINMCSHMAKQAFKDLPMSHMYGASKSAVEYLTRAFRLEAKSVNPGIRVSMMTPGFIQTGIHGIENSLPHIKEGVASLVPMEVEDAVAFLRFMISSDPRVEIWDVHVKPTRDFSFN